MSYTAQELNRKITFQQLTIEQDPNTGAMLEVWTDYASVFAKVEPLLGREFWAAAATQAEDSIKFTMRYMGGLDAAMRIAFNGGGYNITSIQNVRAGNRETLIYARKVL